MNLEVTSVAKKPQKRTEAPAAVFVLTATDLRRAGVKSIPDALRLAPGVHVARITANRWAISIRGFGGRFTNKLLVLIDGRSVYTPLFGGVYWEVQDTLLEDVERIEVIRGPGGTLWGANAVNGVINIITKSAQATSGGYGEIGGGNEEHGYAALRYGTELSDYGAARAWIKAFNRDGGAGGGGFDDWRSAKFGLRADTSLSDMSELMTQTEIYYGEAGQRVQPFVADPALQRTVDDDVSLGGGHLLAKWSVRPDADSTLSFQFYYDRTYRREKILREDRDTVDLEFQHRFALPLRQELVYGFGYRLAADDFHGTASVRLDPASRNAQLFSGFVQDEITLFDDRLRLTVGTKLEHNDYSGFEFQPSATLLGVVHPKHVLWGAVSRAVRTPTRSDTDVLLPLLFVSPGGDSTVAELRGDPMDAEELVAYELGYRGHATDRLHVDLAFFFNRYDDLSTFRVGDPQLTATGIRLPFRFTNGPGAEAYGAEVAVTWEPVTWWRMFGSYAVLQADPRAGEGSNPENQATFRSSIDIDETWQLDIVGRYVDRLSQPNINSYLTGDMRLSHTLRDGIRLSIVGRNLGDRRHLEARDSLFSPAETAVERSFFAQADWSF